MTAWQTKNILIIGKTYPEAHKNRLDTVCTGGITDDGNLIRLYPVHFRYLDIDKQYPLFSWIRVNVKKSSADTRKESYQPDPDSIQVLSRVKEWKDRWPTIQKCLLSNLEDMNLINDQEPNSLSMGIIKVNILKYSWIDVPKEELDWSLAIKEYMMQEELFMDKSKKFIKKLPVKLKVQFKCVGSENCKGHNMTVLSWDMNIAYFKFLNKFKTHENALNNLKMQFEKQYIRNRDVFLYLGTLFQHRKTWIIGSVFGIPKGIAERPIQSELF